MKRKNKKLVERNSRKLIKALESDGRIFVSARGSHHKFKHPDKPDPIIVPHPKRDLAHGIAKSIHDQAGWNR